ncbi:MAG: hypothetical protein SFW64_06430 [Alphaproteobacteria bacterium]|nr:hypothetical protein [Alphaproteobacteria bacterium]
MSDTTTKDGSKKYFPTSSEKLADSSTPPQHATKIRLGQCFGGGESHEGRGGWRETEPSHWVAKFTTPHANFLHGYFTRNFKALNVPCSVTPDADNPNYSIVKITTEDPQNLTTRCMNAATNSGYSSVVAIYSAIVAANGSATPALSPARG